MLESPSLERFHQRTGSLAPVERDEPTREIRYRPRSESVTGEAAVRSCEDAGGFVAARLPGAGVHLGMS
ncbi:hypothetical protein GCM10009647_072610 [Streptomyces sanglieri]